MAAAPAPATRGERWSWWSWDFGASALNSVMISFVFSVYVTGAVAGDATRGQAMWADAQTLTGILLAVLAPMMGAWADRARHRRGMLTAGTLVVIAAVAACYFVRPAPEYLLLGVGLLAVAAIVQEITGVFYNGMLLQISTPANIGRVSAIGWGAGYLGGVFVLVAVLYGFVLKAGCWGCRPRGWSTSARWRCSPPPSCSSSACRSCSGGRAGRRGRRPSASTSGGPTATSDAAWRACGATSAACCTS